MRLIFCFYALLMMAACGVRQDSNVAQPTDTTTAQVDPVLQKPGANAILAPAIPVSGDFLNPKMVFVLNREGARVMKAPSEYSEVVDHHSYGAVVTIDVDSGDWYIVKLSQNSDASKGYLPKTDAVNELSIPLGDDELNYGGYTAEGLRSEYIEVKLISKHEFYDKAKHAITTLLPAKAVPSEDGVLQLKTGNGFKRFTNKITDTYNTYYHLLGEIAMLNAYVVEETCQECEDYSYILVDKNTGEETTFGTVPDPSPRSKEIISISNEYDGENLYIASVFFYTFSKDTIQQVAHKEFPLWSVANSIDGFWGDDGWYYVPVLPSIANWDAYSSDRQGTDFNFRYIRIRHKQAR